MSNLAQALGKKFIENQQEVRIRSFELGGHTFKVRVPLTVEADATYARLKNVDTELLEKYYTELTKDLMAGKDEMPEEMDVKFADEDVIVAGRSMREASKNKLMTEMRITEMVRLLVPEDKEFDMGTITYADIDQLFPLPIQMQLVEKISEVISFDYGKTKEK
jgi:hypothetical protein